MTRSTRQHAPRGACVALIAAVALTGCSSSSSSTQGSSSPSGTPTGSAADTSGAPSVSTATATASPGSTTYLSAPAGVSLTAEGTALKVGTPATVAWQPRQGLVGVLAVKVSKVQKASFKRDFVGWDIKSSDRSTQPYFVHAQIVNKGTTQLGGRDVPLYIVDGSSVLVEASSFASTFKPCAQGKFPATFAPGDVTSVCLVYLAPHQGKLTAVSFRPTEDFDPITWTGKVLSTSAKATKKHHAKG